MNKILRYSLRFDDSVSSVRRRVSEQWLVLSSAGRCNEGPWRGERHVLGGIQASWRVDVHEEESGAKSGVRLLVKDCIITLSGVF